MGIDYSVRLGVGYILDREDIIAPFRVEVPEKCHYEDRYDPKTGQKSHLVKVVDAEATTEYEVDKKRFSDPEEVFDHLCKKVGGEWESVFDDGETHLISIEPKVVNKKNGRKLEAKHMARVCEDASQIRILFKKNWGIELEEPEIQTVETWG
jgi:hypothetical protein